MEISSVSSKKETKPRRHSIGTIIPKNSNDSKSRSSIKIQSQKTEPHYLRASTGSCHDFCKFGGRNAYEEEKTILLSNKKKSKSKPPQWKDILSYDSIPKISKPSKVSLMETRSKSVPSKPKLIRQISLERPIKPVKLHLMHRNGSMEISSNSYKDVVSVKPNLNRKGSMEISSNSIKPVVSVKPNLNRKDSMEISSTSVKPVVSVKPKLNRKGSVEISRNLTKINNGAKKINGNKIEVKKHEIGTEIKNRIVHQKEIKNGTGNENENGSESGFGEEKMIYTIRSEFEEVDSNFCEDKLNSDENFEEIKPALDESVQIVFEKEREKGIMNGDCAFNEPILKSNIESVSSEPIDNIESVLSEHVLENKIESMISEPVSENNIESVLSEIRDISVSDPNAIGEKSGSSETSNNSEMESESESESESIEEEEYEFETESENEHMETNGNNESLNFTKRSKRNGVIKEEEKGYKLKFKPGRIIELKPDNYTPPKRLKFRKHSERNPNPILDSCKKSNYKKKNRVGSDLVRPVKVDSEPVNSVLLRHQNGQEKKEGQNGLFNNVIEETASKLAESRKSKVKALVGAFETVISLQDGKP